MAEKKTIELEIKYDSVKNLKTQLREAQQEVQILAEKFGATSREATEAAIKAAKLKDAIGDAKALTDAFNPDAKFRALSSSLGGVAGGFSAVQGAMGLFGNESENVQKSLLKVQSAMALSQGLQQFGEAKDSLIQLGAVIKTKVVGAFSTLKGAIISTGIGLLVIAIGALISNFDKLKNVISENTANAQKFVDSTRAEGEAARATANDFAEYERTLKRLGYTEDEIRSKRGTKLKDAIANTEKEIEANKKLYKEQLANLETVYKYDKLGLNATGRALYGSEEDAANTRENITKLRKELEKLKNDLFEYDQKTKEGEKEKTKVVKKNTKERKDVVKEEAYDSAKAELEAKQEALLKIIEAENAYEDSKYTAQQQELREVEDKYFELIERAKQYNLDTKELEEARLSEVNIINKKYSDELEKYKKSVKEDEWKREEDFYNTYNENVLSSKDNEINAVRDKYFTLISLAEQYGEDTKKLEEKRDAEIMSIKLKSHNQELSLASDAFNAIGNFTELMGKRTEKERRRAFKIKKAADLASATIDGTKAVLSTYADTPGGPVIKGVAAGIAGAFSAIQIAKIAGQQFDGGGSFDNGGGNKVPSPTSTQGGVIAPTFNVNSGTTNQLNTLQQQPIQAYVVSGQVTSAQSLDRNRIKNATL